MISVIIAVAIGVTIFSIARWAVNLLATPVPEEPDPDEIVEVAADFRCTVCGLKLTVTHAQHEEVVAPRHCREEMVPA